MTTTASTTTPTSDNGKQLTLLAFITAKAGQSDELGRRLSALVDPTRAEPGCINYDLHRSNDDPSVWVIYENWRTPADLDYHFQTEHFLNFKASSHEVLGDEMDLWRCSMTSTQIAPNK
ncbi:MAG: antibiotic biosynthesis monooxygenase family protein [Chthoniobacteraceae bacterium]